MIEETKDLLLNRAAQHEFIAAYLAIKASREAQEVFDRVRQVARDSNSPSTEEPPERPSNQGGTKQREPEPIDPPDNQSLPGDPSVTRPDY